MKAILIMFDSLNRRYLPPYGCDWVHAPNFQRLAERAITFDNCYVGSMPCIPARRELHTGRHNFLHRSWGPLEPFDDSMPEILKNNGVYTHLTSDHPHYWEDGGATYHTRYSSWEIVRGQEGDPWKGQVNDPDIPPSLIPRADKLWRQDWVNRAHMQREEDHPQARTFSLGLEFIYANADADDWFLQIECFDPHEPFFAPQKYKDLYPHEYPGPHFDWPPYRQVEETPEQVQHAVYEYAALVSMCDAHLGQVLDAMDELDLWSSTLLILCTDHGFLLGEHSWWAKNVQPYYNELAHTPLFIWDPRTGSAGQRRDALVQFIDFAPTLLDFFGVPIPKDMQGVPLRETLDTDTPIRRAALFGVHSGHVNCTDGRYVYMRAPVMPENQPLFNYTLMPTHMRTRFSVDELRGAKLVPPFSFTKGCPVLKVPASNFQIRDPYRFGTLLFDLQTDPAQEYPFDDEAIEAKMIHHLVHLMQENDAPAEQFERLGLSPLPKGER
ncbi:MAG: sulfatase [Chloroflexota bacterium]|nr:sulfatase [Chloroflexota bacterium]